MGKIDVNRGAMYRRSEAVGNIGIWMYIDTPGVYYDDHENEVSEEIARTAGYDVERFRKDRIRRERLAAASSAIEAELEIAGSAGEEEVLAEDAGYKVIGLPLDNAHLVDIDGNRLTPNPVSRPVAMKLFESLTAKPAGKAETKKAPAKKAAEGAATA